jgi:hypothetical protein
LMIAATSTGTLITAVICCCPIIHSCIVPGFTMEVPRRW